MTAAAPPEPEEFLSGETGHVAGIRRTLSRTIGDALLDLRARTAARALDRLAATVPQRARSAPARARKWLPPHESGPPAPRPRA